MRSGGFKIVSSRRRGRKSVAARPPPAEGLTTGALRQHQPGPASEGSASAAEDRVLDRRLDEAAAELRASTFVKQLLARLQAIEAPGIDSLVCLGIGHFAVHRAARFQFALALVLRDELLPASAGASGLHVYDPVLDDAELRCILRRGGCVRPHNEEGRVSSVGERCLCYLPHCTRQLYSNLLEANWGADALPRLVVLGNSFEALASSAPSAAARSREAAWCRVTRAAAAVREQPCEPMLREPSAFEHAFGSTSLHTFDAAALPPAEWARPFEPWPKTDLEPSAVPTPPPHRAHHGAPPPAAPPVGRAPTFSVGRVYPQQPHTLLDEGSATWPSPGTGAWPTPTQADALCAKLRALGIASIASIGCGDGAVEAMLESRGLRVYAVDLDVLRDPAQYTTFRRFCREVRRVRPDELFDIPQPHGEAEAAATALGFFWGRSTPWRAYLAAYPRLRVCVVIGEPVATVGDECATEPSANALDAERGWRCVHRMPVRAVHPAAELCLYERAQSAN